MKQDSKRDKEAKIRKLYKIAGILGIIDLLLVGVPLTTIACKKEPEVYKIGAILPLLEENKAFYGEKSQKGFNLALEYIKKEMPNFKLKMLYDDSKFKVKQAISSYYKTFWLNKRR